MYFSKKLLLSLFILSIYQTSIADDIFSATIKTEGSEETFGFSSTEDVIQTFEKGELESNFPNYNDNSAATATIDFRGLPLEFSFAQDSTVLIFEIDSLDIHEEFQGNTRDDSTEALKDFILKEGGDIRDKIARALVAESPVDPLAGNPNSLVGVMVDRSFAQGVVGDSTTSSDQVSSDEVSRHSFGMAARFGQFNQGGKDVNNFSLPFSYSFDIDENKTSKLILTLPLTYTRVQNSAQSFQVGIGIGWQQRVTKNWTLTPSINYGVAGSIDLASLGHVISGSLTSIYSWNLGENWNNISLSLANMGAYYKTLPVSIKGIKLDPDLTNYVIKNGIIGIMPIRIDSWNTNFNLKAYITDTEFFGDQLFAEQYNEIGIAFNVVEDGSLIDDLGINVSYLFSSTGDDVEGFNINLGYEF